VWEKFQTWLIHIKGECGIDWKKDPRYHNIRQVDLSNFLLAKCRPQQRDAHNQKGYMGCRESIDDEVLEYLNPKHKHDDDASPSAPSAPTSTMDNDERLCPRRMPIEARLAAIMDAPW
jgi:hypothetical protein